MAKHDKLVAPKKSDEHMEKMGRNGGKKKSPLAGYRVENLQQALTLLKGAIKPATKCLIDSMHKAIEENDPNAPKLSKEVLATYMQLDTHSITRASKLHALDEARGGVDWKPMESSKNEDEEEQEKAPVFQLTVVQQAATETKE